MSESSEGRGKDEEEKSRDKLPPIFAKYPTKLHLTRSCQTQKEDELWNSHVDNVHRRVKQASSTMDTFARDQVKRPTVIRLFGMTRSQYEDTVRKNIILFDRMSKIYNRRSASSHPDKIPQLPVRRTQTDVNGERKKEIIRNNARLLQRIASVKPSVSAYESLRRYKDQCELKTRISRRSRETCARELILVREELEWERMRTQKKKKQTEVLSNLMKLPALLDRQQAYAYAETPDHSLSNRSRKRRNSTTSVSSRPPTRSTEDVPDTRPSRSRRSRSKSVESRASYVTTRKSRDRSIDSRASHMTPRKSRDKSVESRASRAVSRKSRDRSVDSRINHVASRKSRGRSVDSRTKHVASRKSRDRSVDSRVSHVASGKSREKSGESRASRAASRQYRDQRTFGSREQITVGK